MKIYLMQHAHALSKEQDPDEGLSSEGRTAAELSGKALCKLKVGLDLIFSSPKKRSKETAEAIAAHMEISDEKIIETQKVKAMVSPSESLLELEQYSAKSVLICGHLPSLSKLASFLLSKGGEVFIGVQNAGCIFIETEHLFSHSGVLVWSITPELLQYIAGEG